MARTPTPIDLKLLKSLAGIGCTQADAADVMGVPLRTLEDHLNRKGKDGAPSEARLAWDSGHATMRTSLRRFQFEAAKKGNAALLIWLGKQHLSQREDPNKDAEARQGFDDLVAMIRENPEMVKALLNAAVTPPPQSD